MSVSILPRPPPIFVVHVPGSLKGSVTPPQGTLLQSVVVASWGCLHILPPTGPYVVDHWPWFTGMGPPL